MNKQSIHILLEGRLIVRLPNKSNKLPLCFNIFVAFFFINFFWEHYKNKQPAVWTMAHQGSAVDSSNTPNSSR